jgi:hypothetical protein
VMSFREVVARAVHDTTCEEGVAPCPGKDEDIRLAAPLAKAISDGLKAAGYSIHRSGECVHPRIRAVDLGREMTLEEQRLVGLA